MPVRRFRICTLVLFLTAILVAPTDAGWKPGTTRVVRIPFEDSSSGPGGVLPFRTAKSPRVALVLSGGGARGIAQVGVLKALERHGIPVDFIASTSIGAIVGGLYAAGYTVDELENLLLTMNWDELLSLSDETKRSELFVDQKITGERSFVAIRFQGFEPVIPPAVSSGQRLTDYLNTKVLQAPYHAYPDFDHLKIPFRAVSTDLVSGKKIVLSDGSLAEALRASATVPLLFNPIEKDSMKLVDGGLVDNIPTDLARKAGCDLIIAVNSTSGLRREDEMVAPWQTADQIVGIMMERQKAEELAQANVVITPDIGRHVSSDFRDLGWLIAQGYKSAEDKIPEILSLLNRAVDSLDSREGPDTVIPLSTEAEGIDTASAAWHSIAVHPAGIPTTMNDIRQNLRTLFNEGVYRDISAELTGDSSGVRVRYRGVQYPLLRSVWFMGERIIPEKSLRPYFDPLIGRTLNRQTIESATDSIVRVYRANGYSLAQVDSASFDTVTGSLGLRLNEGVIRSINVEGGVRTQEEFVLGEFPLQRGDVFQIDRAETGLTNINSTRLFDYVYLEINYTDRQPALTIRLKERPSQLVRLGVRADDERDLQGLIVISDENFHGIGTELGLSVSGGQRNLDATLGYKSRRFFSTQLTFGVNAFFRALNSYVYTDAPNQPENHWDREKIGEYRDSRYGGSISIGTQLERLGDAKAELILQNVRLKSIENAQNLEEREQLSILRVSTLVDSKDSYPFPTSGIGLHMSYEFAFEGLGGDLSYNALSVMYEIFNSWGPRVTFHPRLTFGFADNTMPLSQEFRLGGRSSFFGLREDDQRGRQLLLLNFELRYFLPIKLLFDTYLRARYDLGTISASPEEIKLNILRHGIGAEIAFRTPVGPAIFGAGKSFYFSKNLPANPIQQGPLLLYFMIGYEL